MPTINDLRQHLFETLEALRDEKHPMPTDRAEAIAKVSQVIVNTGRLECDYLEILGGVGTGFVTDDEIDPDTEARQSRLAADRMQLIARKCAPYK